MITYEMPLLLRLMTRPELVSTLKRTAGIIFDQGGIIRRLDSLGTKDLPYRISSHGAVHRRASQFIIEFVVPPSSIKILKDEFERDIDVVRSRIYKVEELTPVECTLHEEILPPAYRKDVQEMVELAKKKFKPKFKNNTGLSYYPFQK
ncbi:hypothetical protein R5R35_014454 [Gryllus longicercus]|uniref:Small ribosomal subunit protein bS6m n=1 Tax=Gryllus longicercus TaxID=2509291 RepID=A0AAN9V8R4_9ORTH|nr:Probable 28S ribosomal protein S6, mitochondrial [Gryllus bimaculatus]